MKTIAGVLIAVAALALPEAASAAVTLSISPGPGVNLGNIHVGDSFELDVILSGTAGEYFVSGGGGGQLYSPNLSQTAVTFGRRYNADFSTNPDLFDITVRATTAGMATVSTVGESITSNWATYTNLSSPTLTFNVLPAAAVPEPASWAMMILGLGMVGGVLRRRVRASEVKFDAKIKRLAAAAAV